ncbi:MAG TPA: SsrA-binding protein SmpB [Actinomycetota bacterium]
MAGEKATEEKTVATNRRARFDYEIEETYEAGIVLVGSEVKSLRAGKASLNEAYARVANNEVWLEQLHIPPYAQASTHVEVDPLRTRKLLLHRDEIGRLIGKTQERGLTLVPMKLYFKRGRAKVLLGLGKGKRRHEKRQAIAEREHAREVQRELARRGRR